MSANIKTWKERVNWLSDRPAPALMVEAMNAEIADWRAYDAALAATAPTVSKPCFMCNGTGQHEIPLAIPAGVEPPPARMVACQQCKAAPTVAVDERERFRLEMTKKFFFDTIDFHRDDSGAFIRGCVQDLWNGWQARAKLSAGWAQGGHVDASASGVSPVPKGESGGLLGGPAPAGVAIPEGWQPIETAPKDATHILICRATDAGGEPIGEAFGLFTQRAAWWAGEDGGRGAWIVYSDMIMEPTCFFEPTHWMHIPAAPSPDQQGE